jgi:hypothetical protein
LWEAAGSTGNHSNDGTRSLLSGLVRLADSSGNIRAQEALLGVLLARKMLGI